MNPQRPSVADKRRSFHELHRSGCFVLPNPWDMGSACWLQGLGFKALASTSSGFAWSIGRADNAITRDLALEHLQQLVAATDVPVNADFENGFGADADAVADSVRLAVATGVAGLSIEDSTGDATRPLFAIDEAVQRIKAARRAIDQAGGDTLLVGRAEGFLHGNTDLSDALTRLRAYADAGADCLYAPGVRTPEQIRTLVEGVAPKPFNLLVGWQSPLTLDEIAALGVRRVSVGGAMARAAWGGFQRAAQQLLQGSFAGFADAAPGAGLNAFFHDDVKRRGAG